MARPLHRFERMTRPRPATLMIPLLALASLGLAGCVGCAADRHAEAQAPDGGAPPPPPEPEPLPAPETVPRAPYAWNGPARCFVEAQRRVRLLDDQAFLLCQGAVSAGPVDCYVSARRDLMLDDRQRLTLCRCAGGPEPVECVDLLERETWLTDAQMVELCAPSIVGRLLPNCRPAGGW